MKVEGQSGGELQFFPENPVVGDSVVISLTQDYGQNASYHWYFGDSYFPNTILLLNENQAVTSSNSVLHLYSQPGLVSVRVKITTGVDSLFLDKALLIKESEPNPCLCVQNQMCDYISNGSFECHTSEPDWSGQISFACPWLTTDAGADLYSTLAAPQNPAWPYWWQVPESHFGIQIPYLTNTVTSYAGFVAENHLNYSQLNKRREYLYQKLSRPLTPGVTYEVSMKVSLAEGSTIYSPVGMFLTNKNPVNNNPVLPNAFYTNVPNQNAQGFVIQSTHHINNTNWEVVSGYITPATSDIEYIIISKFNDTPCTEFSVRTPDPNYWPVPINTTPGSGSYDLAYYFVDDVQINPVEFNNFSISGYKNSCTIGSQYTASLVNNNLFYKWEILPTGLNCGTISPATSGFGLSTVSINWNEQNFPANSDYITLQLTISDGCMEKTVEMKVYRCCHEISSTVVLNNYTIPSNTTVSIPDLANVEVNGDLKIYGNFIIEADNLIGILMGRHAKITVYPGATMIVSGKVSFSMLCHAYMWDGIYSIDRTSVISFQENLSGKPSITDAINGIVSDNGGKISVLNTFFNQNYNSICIRNYLPDQPNYQGPLDVQISGCSFTMSPLVPGISNVLNYAPYEGEKSNSGIFIQSAEVTVGELGQNANFFENLQRGVFSINSVTEVRNANFKNIPPEADYYYSWPYKQAGVVSVSDQEESTLTISPLLTAGGLNGGLTFNDCYVGISAQNTRADVLFSNFTDCRMPIHVLNPIFPSTVKSCQINKGSLNSHYDIEGTGISVISVNPSTDLGKHKVTIGSNSIIGMRNGIHCFNQNNVNQESFNENWVLDNEIRFIDGFQTETIRTGILVENCDGINIHNNRVSYLNGNQSNGDLLSRGLTIARSPGSLVYQNWFYDIDAGIYTKGDLLNTQFPCNRFYYNWNGFYFGPFTALSDQHFEFEGDFYCTNNRWIGTYSNPGNHYKLTQITTGGFLTTNTNWFYNSTLNPEFHPDYDLISGGFAHYCQNNLDTPTDNIEENICPDIDSGFDTIASGMDTIRRNYLFGEILNEQIIYDTLTSQNRFYEKDYLFTFLLRHPEAINLGGPDDISYQNFMDSMNNTNSAYIQKVYDFLRNQRLDSASYYNDMISNADNWIANRKCVNGFVMQYWTQDNYDITEDDSLTLLAIALQTPYEGGDGVYTARCLLNLFDVECMGTPYSSLILSSGISKLNAWPNPADEWVTIELPDYQQNSIFLEISATDGRLVKTLPVSENLSEFRFRSSFLGNGCYFLQLKSAGNVLGVSKICIIR